MIIAVDFDGTIHDGQWPGIGRPLPNAREEINALHAEGHYWLLEQDIHFDRVNDHRPDQVTAYGTDARKVYAHCYVDDKNVGGMLPWKDIALWIRRQEAAYKAATEGVGKEGTA